MRKDVVVFTLFCHLVIFAFIFATAKTKQNESDLVAVKQPIQSLEGDLLHMPQPLEEETEPSPSKKCEDKTLLHESVKKEKSKAEFATECQSEDKLSQEKTSKDKVLTVVVKKGDSLEKIARTHAVSVKDIMTWNKLFSDKLSLGQTLKLHPSPHAPKVEKTKEEESCAKEYYELKKGDSLWKVAQDKAISYRQLVRLNDLTEEKARNLQIGDRIRIR